MRNLLTALLLLLAVLHAPAAPQAAVAPQAATSGECWEIVTDIYIGVQTEPLSAEERAAYGESLHKRQGLRIKQVLPASPAEKAGLKPGDLVLKNNGAAIRTMEDLLLSVRNTRPGELVHFHIQRDGARQTVPVRVEALPQPAVVAHARLATRDLPALAAMAENQANIARLLSAEVPDLQAIRQEFAAINKLFPYLGRPGQVRLYYETDFGYTTVTCYPAGITVTIQSGMQMQAYHLSKQGDTLPESLRKTFSEL